MSKVRFSWSELRESSSTSAVLAALAAPGLALFWHYRSYTRAQLADTLLGRFPEEWTFGFEGLSALLAAAALVVLIRAFFCSHAASCPCCGKTVPLDASGRRGYLACPHCRAYLEQRGEELSAVDEACLAPKPAFAAVCPSERFQLPDKCCVCCGAAARRLRCDWEVLLEAHGGGVRRVRGLTVGQKGFSERVRKCSIEVPYCKDHQDGVLVTQQRDKTPVVRFRSYAYLREFCGLNSAAPGAPDELWSDES